LIAPNNNLREGDFIFPPLKRGGKQHLLHFPTLLFRSASGSFLKNKKGAFRA
jgi:hypothetical protein